MDNDKIREQVFNLKSLINNKTSWKNKWSKIEKDFDTIEILVNSNPITQKAVNIWQAVADYYDLKAVVNISKSEKVNEQFRENVQNLIDYKIQPLIKPLIKTLAEKGNSYFYITDKTLVMQEPDFVNLYWNSFLQKPYFYRLELDGVETKQELTHGKDIYHVRNPFDKKNPLSTAPVENARQEVEAYLSIFNFVKDEFTDGLSGNVLATVSEQFKDIANENNKDGVANWASWAKETINWFGKTHQNKAKGSKVLAIPYIESYFKYGSNMADMQSTQVLEKLVELIANGFNLVAQDLGFGRTTNTNTVEFAEQQEEKIGKPLKQELELFINTWLLPKYFGLETKYTNPDIDFCVEFEPPNNEDNQAKRKTYLELFKLNVLTKQEIRQVLVDDFDLDIEPEVPEELTQPTPENTEKEIDSKTENETETEKEKPDEKVTMSLQKKNYQIDNYNENNSPITMALKSPLFAREERDEKNQLVEKGFLPLMEKVLTKQILKIVENMENNNTTDLSKTFVKLETVLPFNVLLKELTNFADLGIKEAKLSITKMNFNFTEDITEYVTAKTKLLLKGYDSLTVEEKSLLIAFKDYQGLDDTTFKMIDKLIQDNVELETSNVIDTVKQTMLDTIKARAENIAETEVGIITEEARFETFSNFDYKFKRWLTVLDERVRHTHRDNESEGVIPINQAFSNGNMKAGEDPRCRCTVIYGVTREEIE